MDGTVCATCTVTGYPCRNLKTLLQTSKSNYKPNHLSRIEKGKSYETSDFMFVIN